MHTQTKFKADTGNFGSGDSNVLGRRERGGGGMERERNVDTATIATINHAMLWLGLTLKAL